MSAEDDLFHAALRIDGPAERAAYLLAACEADEALRARLGSLLAAHDETGNPLDRPPPGLTIATDPGAREHSAGEKVGPYTLLQKLGEGGMGTVWEADQHGPIRRRVALKLIKPGMDSAQVLRRFEAERQALALMDHTNIAKVFDADTTPEGRPFFAMELVKGVPITKYCDDLNLCVRERLELFVPVCQAIQHAHQKGVIHRDVKPSNVLVCIEDGEPVPKVIDFGVAKALHQRLADRTMYTELGAVIGTLEYMSPEQAELSALDVDTRADVYALGALLYELLTGTTPLDRQRLNTAGLAEMMRIIREEEPPKPSTRLSGSGERLTSVSARRRIEPAQLTKLVRGELDWIVMKCLEKDRSRRYETVNALVADVRRYLNDEAVQACPPSTWYRFGKLARRNKIALATASVVGCAVLAALAALATSTFLIARQQRLTAGALDAETTAKADLNQSLRRERVDGYFHRIALAHRELASDKLGRALQLLEECPEDLRAWEWHYLNRLCRVEPLVVRDAADVNGLAFSPDGELLAAAGGDGAIKIWNGRTGSLVRTLKDAHGGFVSSVAYHRDGKHLASVGADKQVKVWDLANGLPVFASRCDAVHVYGTAHAAAFSPDGRQLAAGSDGAVMVWDWESGQLMHAFPGHEKRPFSVAFDHAGRLASGSWRGNVNLWDAATGNEPLRTFPVSRAARHPVTALAFSPDDERLATSSFNRRVDVWDTKTGGLLRTLPHSDSGLVLCVAWSPDGRYVASAGEDKTVRIWEATTGRDVLGLRGHSGQCGCVVFSPDGRRLASGGKDGTIRVWDATPLRSQEGQEVLTFTEHDNEIWSLAVSPDGRQVVSAGFSAAAKVWNTEDGRVSADFAGHSDIVFCVAWQPPDGRWIASAGGDGGLFTVKVWDSKSGEAFTLPDTAPGDPEFFAAAFSRDGRYLVTGQRDGTVRVWDTRTRKEVAILDSGGPAIRAVVISPDGRRLAASRDDGAVKLWDTARLPETKETRLVIRARVPAQCLNIAFSPDGQRLATAGAENTVVIWDVSTGGQLQTFRGHNGDIYTVAFSPDGRWIASAGEDSTVKVWDSHAGGPSVRSFRGHTGLVSSVAFTPDGKRLISGSRDHTAKVWDVTPLRELPER